MACGTEPQAEKNDQEKMIADIRAQEYALRRQLTTLADLDPPWSGPWIQGDRRGRCHARVRDQPFLQPEGRRTHRLQPVGDRIRLGTAA